MILNHRTQHTVGQGGFHSGSIQGSTAAETNYLTPDQAVSYVYDCGSMGYPAALNSAIDAYLAQIQRRSIDLLFLSHMHHDHVCGVRRLCDPASGAVPDTIVMPLLNVYERLISFARAADEDPNFNEPFYSALVSDPKAALSELRARQIIFVRRGGDGGAPSPETPGLGWPTDGGTPPRGRDLEGLGWKLIGSGQAERRRDGDASEPQSSIAIYEMDDTFGFSVTDSATGDAWLLAPYVDPAVVAKVDEFKGELAHALGVTPLELDAMTEDANQLLDILTDPVKKNSLVQAYKVTGSLNGTSMCLFSGPLQRHSERCWEVTFGTGWLTHSRARVSWMGTGDAELKPLARRRSFLNHYRWHCEDVQTQLLPHHGSENNFHSDLLRDIPAMIWLAAAAPFKKWRHPSTSVIQAICSSGRLPWVTTDQAPSAVEEIVIVGPPSLRGPSSHVALADRAQQPPGTGATT